MNPQTRQINSDKTKLLEGADSKDLRIFKDQALEELSSQDKDTSVGFLSTELEPPRHQRSVSSNSGADGCCSKLRSLKQRLNLSGENDQSYKMSLCQLNKFKPPGYHVLDGSVSLPRKHPLKTNQSNVTSPSDYCSVYVGSNPGTSTCGLLTTKHWSRNNGNRMKTPSPSLHSPSDEVQLISDPHVIHSRRNEKTTSNLRQTYSKNNSNSLSDSNNSLGSSGFHSQSSMEPSMPSTSASNWKNGHHCQEPGRIMSNSVNAGSTTTTTTSTPSASPVQPNKHTTTKHSSNFKLQNGDGLRYLAQSVHATGKTFSKAEENNFRSCSHAERMLHRMEMCLHKRQLCDVVLTCGGRSIPSHRIVLSAASDYFAAMFTNELLEAEQEEVLIKGVEPVALLTCIKYIYTGQLDLEEDTVESILSASCLLQLNEVSDSCGKFLSKQLHPSNCIGIRQFADVQGCSQLYANADAYVLDNFVEVVKNQEFYLLSADDMARLLSSDDICVTSEVTVFEALLSWAHHDDPARRKELSRLLAYVRLPLLPAQYIADKVATCPLFREDMLCQELIMESLKYHLLPERRLNMLSTRTRPRKSTVGVLYAVGGMDCSKGSVSIEMYDMRTNQWQQVANMNGRRLQFGVAILDSTLYVVGGRDGLKTLNTVECFDPKSKTWTSIPSMATHRHGLGVGVLEGPMYAVGGHDGWSYLSTVERWDPQAKQWSYVASLSTARSTAGVAVLGSKLYAVGGRDGSSCLRSVECYDPHINRWTLCSPMNKRRGGVGVAVCNDFLYAVGGHDAPSSNPASSRFDCVERYDFKTDTWTTVTPISFPRDAVGVCVLGDKLFAVGGYDGQQYLNNVECYDTQNNEWSTVAPLCIGRAGACVVHLPAQI